MASYYARRRPLYLPRLAALRDSEATPEQRDAAAAAFTAAHTRAMRQAYDTTRPPSEGTSAPAHPLDPADPAPPPAAAPRRPRRCRTAPPTGGRTLHNLAQAHLPALTRGSAAASSSAPTFFGGGQAGSASRQPARPSQCRATPRRPTPINRTASAATRAGLPRTAVTARTAPSRRSLLHRLQTCRGSGMGADQVVRRPQRLGAQPRRQQRMSGYRHRVIAKPGQGVGSPPVCR